MSSGIWIRIKVKFWSGWGSALKWKEGPGPRSALKWCGSETLVYAVFIRRLYSVHYTLMTTYLTLWMPNGRCTIFSLTVFKNTVLKKMKTSYISTAIENSSVAINTFTHPHRVPTEWPWPLSGVHSLMMVKPAQHSEGEGCTPSTFHYHEQSCNVRSRKQGRYTPPISSLPLYVICAHPDLWYNTDLCLCWQSTVVLYSCRNSALLMLKYLPSHKYINIFYYSMLGHTTVTNIFS